MMSVAAMNSEIDAVFQSRWAGTDGGTKIKRIKYLAVIRAKRTAVSMFPTERVSLQLRYCDDDA